MELKFSNGGKESFLPWKTSFPPLEIYFSSLGNLFFHRWKFYFPRLESFWKTVGKIRFAASVVWRVALGDQSSAL